MNDQTRQVGRLAMRVEDGWWVAYYALPTTMKDALELARVRMNLVADPARKNAFLALMAGVLGDIIEAEVGVRPDMPGPVPAPNHERVGRA